MPFDPVKVADTKAWLDRAAQDERSALHGLAAEPPLLEDVVFHCQQMAEKAMKAFLVWHDVPFRKTHSLEELGTVCLRQDSTLETQVTPAVPLSEYAWLFRYPGEIEEPSKEEAAGALAIAQNLKMAILQRLPKDSHPDRKSFPLADGGK